MKKIIKSFETIINNISGKLVWIGLKEEYLMKKIKANQNIYYCDLLNSISNSKGKGKGKSQNLGIKDFRKFYKKKNIDYVVANIEDIEKMLPRFIPSSIYICSNTIYIYGSNYDYEKIVKRYKRYSLNIEVTSDNDNFLIKVDVSKSKNHFFRDKFYFIIDNISHFFDMISDLIVS